MTAKGVKQSYYMDIIDTLRSISLLLVCQIDFEPKCVIMDGHRLRTISGDGYMYFVPLG